MRTSLTWTSGKSLGKYHHPLMGQLQHSWHKVIPKSDSKPLSDSVLTPNEISEFTLFKDELMHDLLSPVFSIIELILFRHKILGLKQVKDSLTTNWKNLSKKTTRNDSNTALLSIIALLGKLNNELKKLPEDIRLDEELLIAIKKEHPESIKYLQDILSSYVSSNGENIYTGRPENIRLNKLDDAVKQWVENCSLNATNEIFIDRNIFTFRILRNLVSNAKEANPKPTEISFSTFNASLDTKEGVIICLKDNGGGIPTNIRDHIFNRGISGRGSSGLGMYIVHRAITDIGGRIGFITKRKDEDVPVEMFFKSADCNITSGSYTPPTDESYTEWRIWLPSQSNPYHSGNALLMGL